MATASLARTEDFDTDLIKRTVAVGATDDELALYLHDCQRRGVHPLDKLLHFTKRGGKYTPITSIDLFRARAGATGQHAGTDDAVFVEGKPYPVSASVTVYRIVGGVRCPYTATARWAEYFPGEQQGYMWKKMPYTMLGKCAEALALRKAFPQELGGLYTQDEMDQAGSPIDPDMSLEANSLSPQEQLAARQANPQPPRKDYCTQKQQDALRDVGDELGLTNAEKVAICQRYSVKRATHLTVEQCAEMVLELSRRAVQKHLTGLGLSLDDVRLEEPNVTADTPDELDQEQADAALKVLRRAKQTAEAP
jgi:phage recombination protein Bet